MILVTGATGTIGAALVERLRRAGAKVRALTRNPQQARFPSDVEVVGGDLGMPQTLAPAVAGVTRVFAASEGHLRAVHDGNLARAAADAGVRQIVVLSSLAVAESTGNELSRWHAEAERAVRASGVASTILRPNGFMSNALRWGPGVQATGEVHAPFGDLASSAVDPDDIAAVAAAVLLEDGLDAATYPLTGPAALTPRDQARIISEVIGRPVRFCEQTFAEALAQMSRMMPTQTAEAVLRARADAGTFRAQVHPTVETLTGRPATTFEQWVVRTVAAFA
jgi:uncharacterized protein YbjT (DUF2867 family)